MRLAFLNSGRRRALGAAAVVTAFALTASDAGDRASESIFGGAHLEARSWRSYDHFVPSTPENVVWGEFPSTRPPIAIVRSGDIVKINTLSHAGATQGAALGDVPDNQQNHPITYLAQFGVKSNQVLKDVVDFWRSGPGRPRQGRGGHILTGPIYIQDAEPGDMLEIEVLDLETRVPYGINNAGQTSGVLGAGYAGAVGPFYSGSLGDNYPNRLSTTPPLIPPFGPVGNRNLIFTGKSRGREVAFFSEDITVPLGPFMGIMAVAPSPTVGEPGVTVPDVQSSTPPGIYGGNMDVKDLTIGSTLYLPVFHAGALFYTGDPHSAQGDGEVSGTAIEHSLAGTFRFTLHKNNPIKGPRAEDDNYYIMMGIDLDLDRAMRLAVQEVVNFLVTEKGLAAGYAYSLASIAVDFHVGEAVDQTQIVTGKIPKSIFKKTKGR